MMCTFTIFVARKGYVALMSGLSLGSTQEVPLRTELLIEYLVGELGSAIVCCCELLLLYGLTVIGTTIRSRYCSSYCCWEFINNN